MAFLWAWRVTATLLGAASILLASLFCCNYALEFVTALSLLVSLLVLFAVVYFNIEPFLTRNMRDLCADRLPWRWYLTELISISFLYGWLMACHWLASGEITPAGYSCIVLFVFAYGLSLLAAEKVRLRDATRRFVFAAGQAAVLVGLFLSGALATQWFLQRITWSSDWTIRIEWLSISLLIDTWLEQAKLFGWLGLLFGAALLALLKVSLVDTMPEIRRRKACRTMRSARELELPQKAPRR